MRGLWQALREEEFPRQQPDGRVQMFIRRMWSLLAKDRRLIVGSVLAGLFFTGLGILPPLLVRQMIRRLEGVTVTNSVFVSNAGGVGR